MTTNGNARHATTSARLDELFRLLNEFRTEYRENQRELRGWQAAAEARLRATETWGSISQEKWRTHENDHTEHDNLHAELRSKGRLETIAAGIVAAVVGIAGGTFPWSK